MRKSWSSLELRAEHAPCLLDRELVLVDVLLHPLELAHRLLELPQLVPHLEAARLAQDAVARFLTSLLPAWARLLHAVAHHRRLHRVVLRVQQRVTS